MAAYDNSQSPVTVKTIRYYYDGQRAVLQAESSSDGLEERALAYGNYIDEVLAMRRKTATGSTLDYSYGHDHLYSPAVLFNAAGDVVERYEYDAYGEVRVMSNLYDPRDQSLFGNTIAFTGRELDVLDNGSLKIMYYRARYYDSETGRFMQRDPLGYISGTSLYEYVNSNPKSFLDPFGFYPWDMPGQEPFWNIETCTCYCGWAVVTSKAPLALEGCLRECYAYDAMKGDSPDHPDPHFNPMPGFDPITTVNQCHDKFRDHCKQKRKPAPPGPPSTPPVVPPTPPEPPVVIPPELPPIILPPPPPPAETWQECVDRVRAERNEERRNRCADLPTRPRRKCIEEVDREYRDKAKTECGPLKKGSSISKHSGIGIIRR
jgi:RHS repeat-associated protein